MRPIFQWFIGPRMVDRGTVEALRAFFVAKQGRLQSFRLRELPTALRQDIPEDAAERLVRFSNEALVCEEREEGMFALGDITFSEVGESEHNGTDCP